VVNVTTSDSAWEEVMSVTGVLRSRGLTMKNQSVFRLH
jgi:hypothetical protein